MSANNNQRNNDQNRAQNPNRIRGPTSALSSFLREHGIRVENRSRQELAERRRQRREQSAREARLRQAAGTTGETPTPPPTDSAAQHDTTNSPSTTQVTLSVAESSTATIASSSSTTASIESILYTPSSSSSRRTRSAQAQAIINAASSSSSTSSSSKSKEKKKKRPANDDESSDDDYNDDSGDDEYTNPQPTSSRTRSASARIRVLFCSRCKCRFVRNNTDPSEETMCLDCVSGKDPANQKKLATKKGASKKVVWFMHGVNAAATSVSSLQEICINVIADHIDDVEALGDISFMNMDRIAKIICRKRQLTNHTARLFMQPNVRELCLYDCTNVDVTGLKNIAHFCPNLRTLRLYYCGRMTDEVIELYGTHLQHLTSLTVSGCHLVTDGQWTRFFETIGDRLKHFSIRHSYRFKKTSFESLVKHCNKLQQLCLSRIVTLSDNWLAVLLESGIRTLETLELSWPSEEPNRKYVLTTDLLTKILAQTGDTLKELVLRGCTDLTDELILDGILPHCLHLQKLTLEGCDDISSMAFQRLFSDEWLLAPSYGPHRQIMTGLQSISVARCSLFDDDALTALLRHSGKSLTRLDIHSLEKLTVSALEAIAGEVVVKNNNTDKESNKNNNSESNNDSGSGDNDDGGSNGYVTGGPGSGNIQHKRLKLGPARNDKQKVGDPGVSTVCTSLVYLDASFVRSMDDYVLTKLIRSCPDLKHIKVWGCHQVSDVVKVPRRLIVEGLEFT